MCIRDRCGTASRVHSRRSAPGYLFHSAMTDSNSRSGKSFSIRYGTQCRHGLIRELARESYVYSETWRTVSNSGWRDGVAIALWPDQKQLNLMDENRTLRQSSH